MKPSQPSHPLTPILITGMILIVLWPLHHFWGIGDELFELALGGFTLFGIMLVITCAIAGIVWIAIKIFKKR